MGVTQRINKTLMMWLSSLVDCELASFMETMNHPNYSWMVQKFLNSSKVTVNTDYIFSQLFRNCCDYITYKKCHGLKLMAYDYLDYICCEGQPGING